MSEIPIKVQVEAIERAIDESGKPSNRHKREVRDGLEAAAATLRRKAAADARSLGEVGNDVVDKLRAKLDGKWR
jgi:hypothetical protein